MRETIANKVRETKCRAGKHAGKSAGRKFWRPFGQVSIQRNMVNYREIASTATFEIRHFDDDDLEVVVKFNDWMDSRYSKEFIVNDILQLSQAKDIETRLRKGLIWNSDEQNEENEEKVNWTPIDNDGWDNLLDELSTIGV